VEPNRLCNGADILRSFPGTLFEHVSFENSVRHSLAVKSDPLLAKRTLEFLFQPIIYALVMEFVRTMKCLHHLVLSKALQADGALFFIAFASLATFVLLLLILEGVDRVYDHFHFLGRR